MSKNRSIPSKHATHESARTGLVVWTLGHQAHILLDNVSKTVDLPGRWRQETIEVRPLAPGDRVSVLVTEKQWKIIEHLPRKNAFTRKAPGPKPVPQTLGANIDIAVIIASAMDPVTPFGFIDRMLVTAALGVVPAALIVNKCDLVNDEISAIWRDNYKNAVEKLIFTSALNRQNLDKVAELMSVGVILIAGSSGVGKTTLINALDPNLNLKTNIVSIVTGKGKHTTSIAKLYSFRNGWLVDTPGLRECAPWDMMPERLQYAFPEIVRLTGYCKFRNCLHEDETGCDVTPYVDTPELPAARYESYLKLLDEAKVNKSKAGY